MATLLVLVTFRAIAADQAERTRSLIAVLRSDASLFDKARACQQLGEIGTPEAVPVLAGLLEDPKLSAYARSGLEGIADPSAAAALRDAALKIKGPLLAGVINSLGVLRDTGAVKVLARLAADPSSGVVTQAWMALGNISTSESIRVLEKALASAPDTLRGEAAAARLLAADRQRTGGALKRAVAFYDLIRKAKVPIACRVGATRGAILARKADRVPFLLEQLRSQELAIRNAALLTIREVPDDTLASALNAEVTRAAPDSQGLLLLALADCHNAQSIPMIQSLSACPNPETRRTALIVLGRLGPDATSVLLAALREDRPADEKAIVLSGLRTLEGSADDELLLRALTSASTPGLRIDLIRLLDSRGVVNATPEILKQAGAPDRDLRIAALSALKSLAGPGELPALIAWAKSSADEEVQAAAENAIVGVCSRSGNTASETVLSELKRATKPAERGSWIRVLAQVGYSNALPTLETAASDSNPQVAAIALTQLGHWPNPAPIETLLKAMDSASGSELRRPALASVLDLAATATDETQVPEPTIVSWLQRANSLAQSAQDKRRILGLLGRLKTIESFRLLSPYLDDSSLRTEAASGIVQIAPALAKSDDAPVLRAALEKIAATVDNTDLRDRAQRIANTIAAAK